LAAQACVGVGQLVLEVGPFVVAALADHLLDGQVAGIEYQLGGVRIGPVQVVGGAATDFLGAEIDIQRQREVLDTDLVGLGVGKRVIFGRRCGGRVGIGSGGIGGRRVVARAATEHD